MELLEMRESGGAIQTKREGGREAKEGSTAWEVERQKGAQQGGLGSGQRLLGRSTGFLSSPGTLQSDDSTPDSHGGREQSVPRGSADDSPGMAGRGGAVTRQGGRRGEFLAAVRRLVEVSREASRKDDAADRQYSGRGGRLSVNERWHMAPSRRTIPRYRGASISPIQGSPGMTSREIPGGLDNPWAMVKRRGDGGLERSEFRAVDAAEGAAKGELESVIGNPPRQSEARTGGGVREISFQAADSRRGDGSDDEELQDHDDGGADDGDSLFFSDRHSPVSAEAESSTEIQSAEAMMRKVVDTWQSWWEETGRKEGEREQNLRTVAQRRLLSQHDAAASLAFILSTAESTADAQEAAAWLMEACSRSTVDLSRESLLTALQILSLSGRSNVALALRDLLAAS